MGDALAIYGGDDSGPPAREMTGLTGRPSETTPGYPTEGLPGRLGPIRTGPRRIGEPSDPQAAGRAGHRPGRRSSLASWWRLPLSSSPRLDGLGGGEGDLRSGFPIPLRGRPTVGPGVSHPASMSVASPSRTVRGCTPRRRPRHPLLDCRRHRPRARPRVVAKPGKHQAGDDLIVAEDRLGPGVAVAGQDRDLPRLEGRDPVFEQAMGQARPRGQAWWSRVMLPRETTSTARAEEPPTAPSP